MRRECAESGLKEAQVTVEVPQRSDRHTADSDSDDPDRQPHLRLRDRQQAGERSPKRRMALCQPRHGGPAPARRGEHLL
jgi:hypothetical protein